VKFGCTCAFCQAAAVATSAKFGTHGLLDSLPIKVVDGNLVAGCAFEVRGCGDVTCGVAFRGGECRCILLRLRQTHHMAMRRLLKQLLPTDALSIVEASLTAVVSCVCRLH
jgi:hypothetical protein